MKNMMTITFGGKSKLKLLEELQKNDVLINEYGMQILENDAFKTADQVQSVQLVELAASDLNFSEKPTTQQLFKKAEESGFELGPIELALHVRLHYLDQPQGARIMVASERVTENNNDPNGFYLQRRDDGLWLRGYKAEARHLWELDEHFIFCLGKNYLQP